MTTRKKRRLLLIGGLVAFLIFVGSIYKERQDRLAQDFRAWKSWQDYKATQPR